MATVTVLLDASVDADQRSAIADKQRKEGGDGQRGGDTGKMECKREKRKEEKGKEQTTRDSMQTDHDGHALPMTRPHYPRRCFSSPRVTKPVAFRPASTAFLPSASYPFATSRPQRPAPTSTPFSNTYQAGWGGNTRSLGSSLLAELHREC